MKGLWGPEEAARVLANRSVNAAQGMDDDRKVANMAAKLHQLQLPGDPDPVTSKMQTEKDENENSGQRD